MKVKILKRVRLHKKLMDYKEIDKSELIDYNAGDIVLDVNDLYFERFSKYPNHIEITDVPISKDEDELYVDGLKKKDVETRLQEMGIDFDSKSKVEVLKSQLLSAIKDSQDGENATD